MNDIILVTGGTGTLGRHLVPLLDPARVRVLSRRPGPGRTVGDLNDGSGLAEAADGAGVIVHCATGVRGSDPTRTRNLLAAAGRDTHLIYISIVGVDRHPFRYYREKHACERMIESAGPPHTIVRTTQFHDLVARVLGGLARLPFVPVPAGTAFQPIDSAEVAGWLAELTGRPPAGRVPDLGGPQIRPLADLARDYLRVRGPRRSVVPVRVPGRVASAFRRGVHLAPDRAVGRRTFAEFLTGDAS
ncbi:SDR family oxidoreductase [Rhizohabitans arisaemae]|uniref:SDR family oxidoreductase n=1 Tax=Rhizohabitans arisaemae TaxID=2720610 RepID=UPI0024B23A0C|nr:SDR family oxidoreductase [Rhizohabitans arisaemae]